MKTVSCVAGISLLGGGKRSPGFVSLRTRFVSAVSWGHLVCLDGAGASGKYLSVESAEFRQAEAANCFSVLAFSRQR